MHKATDIKGGGTDELSYKEILRGPVVPENLLLDSSDIVLCLYRDKGERDVN